MGEKPNDKLERPQPAQKDKEKRKAAANKLNADEEVEPLDEESLEKVMRETPL